MIKVQAGTVGGCRNEVNAMWKIGDIVRYRNEDICRITDIRKERLTEEGEQEYYILESIYNKRMTIYVETGDENSSISLPMDRNDVNGIIDTIPDMAPEWISNDKERQHALENTSRNGSIPDQMAAAVALHKEEEKLKKTGKKLRLVDQQFLTRFESVINHAFAFGIGAAPDDVPLYIQHRLNDRR